MPNSALRSKPMPLNIGMLWRTIISTQASNSAAARRNARVAFTHKPPVYPAAPYVSFPAGTVEIKSAWRPLTGDDDRTHFHVATVRFYENKGEANAACYFEEQWGLVALHIIQKTPSAPSFIYATFEQADNIKTADGKSVEDANGTLINPPPAGTAPTTPGLTYTDSPTAPTVTKTGPFCSPVKQLYFKDKASDTGLTGGGPICVNQRYEPIPAEVIAVNQIAHQAIEAMMLPIKFRIRLGRTTSLSRSRPNLSMSRKFRPPIPIAARRCSTKRTAWSRRITRCSNSRAASTPATVRQPRYLPQTLLRRM